MIGDVLKSRRKELGITQAEMAERLNISQSNIAMWEAGIRTPKTNMLPKIAAVLRCKISDLFQDEGLEAVGQ